MKLLSFDIEISDVFDLKPGEDIEIYGPLHIAVAATSIYRGKECLWYSIDKNGKPLVNMKNNTAHELLTYLYQAQKEGYLVCAWNGLGFDLRWIGNVADDLELAAKVALESYDPMFQFFNQRGFPVGLGAVSQAMGIEQIKSMNAADAPLEWRKGNHKAVMEYVMGDCQITNQVVKDIIDRGEVPWITKKGQLRSETMPELKTVKRVLEEPEPDQSWMDKPIPRSKYTSWIPHP